MPLYGLVALLISAACLLIIAVALRHERAKRYASGSGQAQPATQSTDSVRLLAGGRDELGGVIDLLDDPVCVIDEEGGVMRANRAFCERLQAKESEIRGHHLARFLEKRGDVFRSDGPVAMSLKSRRMATGTAGPCRLGGDLRVTVSPLGAKQRGGRAIESFAVVIRDLTLQHGQEDRVRRLGQLAGALPIVVIEADPVSHRIRYVSGTFKETFGWDEDVMRELEIDSLLGSGVGLQSLREAVFKEGGGQIEIPMRRMGGEQFPARVHGRLLRRSSGAPDEMVLMIEDITREHAMHEQVIRAQKLATLGELSATISHEVASPLMSLLTSAEFLAIELGKSPQVDQDVVGAANDCLEGARRIRQTVDGVRRYAHMGKRGRSPMTFEAAIDSAIQVAASRMGKSATVERPQPFGTEVYGDPGQLAQVLMNLLVNAAQAFEDMGKKGTIRFEQGVEGDVGFLKVIDDGPGIADEVKAKLFKDYVTTKEPGRGTGFGLRISQQLLEEAGGSLAVDSQLGAGTTFTIRLPLANGRPPEVQRKPISSPDVPRERLAGKIDRSGFGAIVTPAPLNARREPTAPSAIVTPSPVQQPERKHPSGQTATGTPAPVLVERKSSSDPAVIGTGPERKHPSGQTSTGAPAERRSPSGRTAIATAPDRKNPSGPTAIGTPAPQVVAADVAVSSAPSPSVVSSTPSPSLASSTPAPSLVTSTPSPALEPIALPPFPAPGRDPLRSPPATPLVRNPSQVVAPPRAASHPRPQHDTIGVIITAPLPGEPVEG